MCKVVIFNAVSLQCRCDMTEVKKKWQDLQSSAEKIQGV